MDEPSGPQRPRPGTFPITVLAVAIVYLAAAKLGLTLAFAAEQVSPVWPPTGIALAAVLLLGPRIWPGIALGAFLANVTAHEPVTTACAIAAGNTLEALVSAWLLGRVRFHTALDRLRDVLALVILAAAGSTAVSATVGTTSLCLGGVHPWAAFGSLWWVWWIGDAIGDLVMAPLLLVWASAPWKRISTRRLVEAAVLLVGVVGVSLIVFVGRLGMPVTGYPLHYIVFPLVVWAALRFGQRGTTTATFCASTVAIWSTINGWGPFAMGTPNGSLVLLQLFMAVVAVTALLLGAAISERNLAERRAAADYARLEVSERRLRLALGAGRMGVWDWNIRKGDVKWSENLEAIFGLPPGAFPGTLEDFLGLVLPDDRDFVGTAITHALADGADYDIEFRRAWPAGGVHWIAVKGTVLRDRDGRPLRMLGVGMDVTERRRLADELTERARQLADADRRKDEFLAMLAHELRNPLTPLSTALHLLRRDVRGNLRFLDMADRQVKQLTRLVDDLLDVSRITQGKVTLRKEGVLLGELIRRGVEIIRPLAEARGQTFAVSIPDQPLRLEADPARLAQVLDNLLSNAVKYTPTGGSIWLTVEGVKDEIVIRVRDTGAGLGPELLPHIFDLFVQGDTSLDRTRGGLGIGLTVVRRLVELHGGRVEARSAGLGQGSEFVVRLRALPDAGVDAGGEVAPRTHAAAGRQLQYLVVEDNEDAAEALAAILRTWGHEVRVAYDGAAAAEAAQRRVPDVVVSDVGLPGMDGYALARQLRAGPGGAKILLIALSGYGRDEDKRQAHEAGFDHHLVKPPDLTVLSDILGGAAAAGAVRAVP